MLPAQAPEARIRLCKHAQRRQCVQIQPRQLTRHQTVKARRADHHGVVGAQCLRRHIHRHACGTAAALELAAQQRIGGYAARHSQLLRAGIARGEQRFIHQQVDHAAPERGGKILRHDLLSALAQMPSVCGRGNL